MNNSEQKNKKVKLINKDCFDVLPELESESIDCIVTDPPYFLSNGGITCKSGKMKSVNKGEWDKRIDNDDVFNFNMTWIKESYRLLKNGGTLWISGTYHNIYTIGSIIENMQDFRILNNVTWVKTSPPPNLSCRFFTHSTETILWVRKGIKSKHFFNYKLMKKMNDDKQMKDVWIIGRPTKGEKQFGKHPTQKPEQLIERIILSSTKEDDVVLDMFNGSGTTGVVCVKNQRNYIGIESVKEYYNISLKRLKNIGAKIT
ncbi:MAG: site-specific DNA-methyltransferase [Gammaproteobacteria bacterium]